MRTLPIRLATAFLALACVSTAWADDDGRILETKTHRITITEHCAEGEVLCDKAEYLGRDRKNGASIRLMGSAHMVMCADGVTPCHVGYYVFRNGQYTYLVYPQGFLEVHRGQKTILSESGEWIED